MSAPRLVKAEAPAYWSRWSIVLGERTVGQIERRGGWAPWIGFVVKAGPGGEEMDLVPGRFGNRALAVAAVVKAAEA
jgi:hypothetical protein